MINMIKWSKIKTYHGNKYSSFEELCYQIAKELYEKEGYFTRVDDSGGGDGVEFYMTLPDGDEWGWQAKFYYPKDRLNQSNRKQSIKDSLERACEKHPRLKRWFLCTPSNFTPGEQDWFKDTLPQSIPENMDTELEHWGDSDFNAWLSEPRFSGKLNFFFGEPELNMDWFKAQFDQQLAAMNWEFDSSLHTETQVDAHVHALLCDKLFAHQIDEWIEELLKDRLPDLEDAIDDLKHPAPDGIEWDHEEKSKVIESAESLQGALVHITNQLKQASEFLKANKNSEVQTIDWKSMFSQLNVVFDTYRKVGRDSGIGKIKYIGEVESEENILRDARRVVHGPDSLVANLLDKFFPSVTQQCELTNQQTLHIFGDAGTGKTHIACNICDNRLKNGLPALFIHGKDFTSEQPIQEQLRSILSLPSTYSWNDFLKALSTSAEKYNTRIPLIIDGLNESTHNGAFSKIWELGLKKLVQEIAQIKNLVLITTCRTSYTEAIWGNKDPSNGVYAYGFDAYDEVEQAVEKYFKTYKIIADLTAVSLTQFEHPIYLKIFCETKNPTRDTEKHIYVGEQTLFEVFDEYLEQCNKTICKNLRRHPKVSIVQSALNKIAKYLWKNSSRYIPLEKLVHVTDQQSIEDLDWPLSKARAIQSEGLLVCRDSIKGKDAMSFTYDLLGGYLIAKYLIQQAAEDVQCFLRSDETVTALFGKDHQALHPMHEDIGRCLAALFPSETGQFLHELSDNEKAYNLSICGMFEISPEYINKDCINLITRLFEHYQNRKPLLRLTETTVRHVNHPLNISRFWSERLSELPMSERDISWTEYVRFHRESFDKMLMSFEKSCQNNHNLSDSSKKRLRLWAEYIMWLLTSTVRPLRDQATRALYYYGRRFPQEFFDLVRQSFSINDPYISERMLAATYGIAMARQHDFKDPSFVTEILPLYGKKLYEAMFKPNAPHSTTHVLARDYARRTIDLVLIHHPDLLTEDERERITPPFTDGGIREWSESEDRKIDAPQKGFPPLQMDFENYTLGGLVKDRGNYNFEHDEYKRVRGNILWRLYNLGYSLDSFEEIDGRLFSENYRKYGRSADGRKTDRYGKKYSWIAFYELAGFRQDKGLLPNHYDDMRILEADIDPSFPIEQKQHNLTEEDFLGNREISTREWVSKSHPPNLMPYLKVEHLCEEQGTWVLLQGRLGQEDKQYNRNMFAFLQGLIVKSKKSTEIVEVLKKQERINRNTIPSVPEDHFTYAGEIPWCDTYPPNNWEEVSLEIGTVLVSKEQKVLLRNGEPVSDEELQTLWDSIADLIEPEDSYAEMLGFWDAVSIVDLIERENWEMIKARLHERGFELKTEMIEVEQPESQTFKMLVPVRDNGWSDSQSAVVPGRSVETPSKHIAKILGLCGQPQSFDLFEKENGRRASITFRYGENWGEMQYFTYLREDLLQRYLNDIDGELIWVIWGEQSQPSQNPDAPYKLFQDVKVYPL